MSSSSNSSQVDEYPYPVTQNVANFVSLCLSSTNFLLWKTQMLNILESYDLQGFITGETKPPSQFIMDAESNPHPNPAFVKWRKSDRLVKGWLTATISEEVLGIVVGLNTSVEVWNALVHAFARVSSDRSLALKQRLTFMTRDSNSSASRSTLPSLSALAPPTLSKPSISNSIMEPTLESFASPLSSRANSSPSLSNVAQVSNPSDVIMEPTSQDVPPPSASSSTPIASNNHTMIVLKIPLP
nr:hypothetical protein CFP56_46105 [Quercus suber]